MRLLLEERRTVPEYLISEPSDVVARLIDGVRRNRLHVFPDKHSRGIYYVARFAPWQTELSSTCGVKFRVSVA